MKINKQLLKHKSFLRLLANVFIGLIGFILLFFPADFFDNGKPICISILLFDKECFNCGMTRAVMHLIHFDFKTAWEYHKLSVVVLPLLIYVIINGIYKSWKDLKQNNLV